MALLGYCDFKGVCDPMLEGTQQASAIPAYNPGVPPPNMPPPNFPPPDFPPGHPGNNFGGPGGPGNAYVPA